MLVTIPIQNRRNCLAAFIVRQKIFTALSTSSGPGRSVKQAPNAELTAVSSEASPIIVVPLMRLKPDEQESGLDGKERRNCSVGQVRPQSECRTTFEFVRGIRCSVVTDCPGMKSKRSFSGEMSPRSERARHRMPTRASRRWATHPENMADIPGKYVGPLVDEGPSPKKRASTRRANVTVRRAKDVIGEAARKLGKRCIA